MGRERRTRKLNPYLVFLAIGAVCPIWRTPCCFLMVWKYPLISQTTFSSHLQRPRIPQPILWARRTSPLCCFNMFQTQPSCLSTLNFAYPLLETNNIIIIITKMDIKSPYGLESKPPHPSQWHLHGEDVLPKSHSQTLGMPLKSKQRCSICTKYTGFAALTIPERPLHGNRGVSFAQTAQKQQGQARYAGKDWIGLGKLDINQKLDINWMSWMLLRENVCVVAIFLSCWWFINQ